jgi:hypothetical protein
VLGFAPLESGCPSLASPEMNTIGTIDRKAILPEPRSVKKQFPAMRRVNGFFDLFSFVGAR